MLKLSILLCILSRKIHDNTLMTVLCKNDNGKLIIGEIPLKITGFSSANVSIVFTSFLRFLDID